MIVTPIIRAVDANGLTPQVIAQRLASPFLLEGTEGGWFDGRYALIGLPPFAVFQGDRQDTRFTIFEETANPSRHLLKNGDPLAQLQSCLDRFKPISEHLPDLGDFSNLPFIHGGAVGFLSYDLIRHYETIPSDTEDPHVPDIYMAFVDHFILFDHTQQTYSIVYNPAPRIALGQSPQEADRWGHQKIEAVSKKLESSWGIPVEAHGSSPPLTLTRAISEEDYVARVARAQKYISAGDIYQANLSQYFYTHFEAPSLFPIYQRLHRINPAPFSAYLRMGEVEIASASPERLLRIKKGADGAILETRPLAGTSPRGKTVAEDHDRMTALCQNPKERAEHLMLVDLERNDVGRVCRFGSVQVNPLLAPMRCSHVWHLVSHVVGRLRDGVRVTEALRALFPGGTITGVPKIRCMQIIAELERSPRGIYTGSLGYIDFSGESDMNIVIRTFIRQRNRLSFHVGAGIVADSDPVMEYHETLHKAVALFSALEPFSLCGSISKIGLS